MSSKAQFLNQAAIPKARYLNPIAPSSFHNRQQVMAQFDSTASRTQSNMAFELQEQAEDMIATGILQARAKRHNMVNKNFDSNSGGRNLDLYAT